MGGGELGDGTMGGGEVGDGTVGGGMAGDGTMGGGEAGDGPPGSGCGGMPGGGESGDAKRRGVAQTLQPSANTRPFTIHRIKTLVSGTTPSGPDSKQ